ncbi:MULTISPECIES: YpdA family putative bacillithiol disulfide reductase [Alteribacter]|uniref:YpdA family putative bacillithiol disulfide reductase n=1 Tax=Alteribacter keqinensis TaxID=2483800 RepID=A0A3M7TUA5_9BACI|nr:YpdA family putative bacillithiol disulfide reductase [Alteribacter keqinensis]MBM7094683.1 YpdA family putative bacillithiol disulfide reductase [Alteribacter salitolerans]RNA69117.1 YpdA family putative bacillithiol disulfide reductase [Alteribacter keqinensis]
MNREDVIIIGAGPCGLSAAIALKKKGFNPLIIERGNVVNAIYRYPTHQQFFSTSEKLAIGGIPFYSTERKPKRNEALVYYREVVKEKDLRINAFEEVTSVSKDPNGQFLLTSSKYGESKTYSAKYVIVATGYYDSPNYMEVQGENLPHVRHYFKEAHPYFDQDVCVIGGKNSAVDAALELDKAGARVTVLYRGEEYSKSVKPWILPEFDGLVRNGAINMVFNACIDEITEEYVSYSVGKEQHQVKADFVFAMTGYHPDHSFIKKMGVTIDDDTGRPEFNAETMETNCEGIYIAGVIAAGNNANEIFIENGRHHGGAIAASIILKEAGL